MRLIDADHLKETLDCLACESDNKVIENNTNQVLHDLMPQVIADEPTVKVPTKEQYDAAVMRVLSNVRTRAYSTGSFGIADEGMLLLFEALMKCLLKDELFGGNENEETNHSHVC